MAATSTTRGKIVLRNRSVLRLPSGRKRKSQGILTLGLNASCSTVFMQKYGYS